MIKMQIFGGFSLHDQETELNEQMLHSRMLTRVVVYILLHRDRKLTHQELIDVFWQDEGARNPEGALKNTIYRLRTELKRFGKTEMILTLPGAYHWNPEVPVEVDCEVFEELAKAARNERSPEKRKLLCERAIQLYRRETSPQLATENWMLSKLTYYKILYMETAKLLAKSYEEAEDWNSLEILTRATLEIDSLDEDFYYWLIRSQIGEKNYERAIEYYENGKKIFYEHLGIRNIDRFDELYDEIMRIPENQRTDITSLMRTICEQEPPKGVFECAYPVFRELYRVEARRIRRTGIAEYMLLITLKTTGSGPYPEALIAEGMQILQNLLREALRIGDVASRYSRTQYVLLLPTCSYESTLIVAERLEEKFKERAGTRRLRLQFEAGELLTANGS